MAKTRRNYLLLFFINLGSNVTTALSKEVTLVFCFHIEIFKKFLKEIDSKSRSDNFFFS
jgi:hypothetical protein